MKKKVNQTAKITLEAEPELVEAILEAIDPVLDIADAGRNARLARQPHRVRRQIRAAPAPAGDFIKVVRQMSDLRDDNQQLRAVVQYAQLLAYLVPVRVWDPATGQEASAEQLYSLACDALGTSLGE